MRSKHCPKCNKELPISKFYKAKRQKTGYQLWCMDCQRLNSRSHYKNIDLEKRRRWSRTQLLRKYGLTIESYDALLKEQGGVCAICLQPETSCSSKGIVDSLRVDHCHSTGVVRGLLCSECNFGISKFDDSMGKMMSAVSYLLKFKQELK